MAKAVWQGFVLSPTNGKPVSGAEVHVKDSDSGAYVTLYADRDGAAWPASNPFSTGPDGFVQFYVDPARIRVEAYDGAQVTQFDNVLVGTVDDGGIVTANLADDAVTTDKILNGAVTSDKVDSTVATTADLVGFSGGAPVYADTTAGLAGTTEGDYFNVPSSVSGELLILYRHDSGPTATEVGRSVSADKFSEIIKLTPPGHVFSIVDQYGRAAFAVADDGDVAIATIGGKNVAEWLVEAEEAQTLLEQTEQTAPNGYAFSILDGQGRAALGVTDDGAVAVDQLQAETLNGISVDTIISGQDSTATYRRRYPSEINMVLSYGQSLSVGADGTPAISTTQKFDSLMFVGGVRSQDSGTPYTSLVPLVEADSSTLGETPVAGATEQIKELVFSEDGLAYTDHNFQLLGSAPGAGGTAIAGLSSGTTPYNRFVADVQAGFDLSQDAEKSFKVGAFFWSQAESDYINDTPAATYKTALVTLRNDLEADVQTITGQSEPLACISYQVQGHATYGYPGNPYLAVAQLEVARENANHYVACPLYWSPQSVHQTADNYKRLGAYYGLAYKRIVIDGEDWRPVEPLQVDVQGTIILIRFNVPSGALELDTALQAMQTDYGFSVVDSVDSPVAISSVTIVGPDTVKIVTASDASGGRVQYGFVGDGGNLRDQQGDSIVFDPTGLNYPMHNWCVIFEETL